SPTLRAEEVVDRRAMRFHGGGTAWNHVAMDQAIVDSGLAPDEVSHERTGIVMGSGGPSTRAIVEAADIARAKGPKRVGPFAVPKSMSSTASATWISARRTGRPVWGPWRGQYLRLRQSRASRGRPNPSQCRSARARPRQAQARCPQ